MRLTRTIALVALCTLAACGDFRDRKLTRESWQTPLLSAEIGKMTPEERVAFHTYRNQAIRLDRSEQNPPQDITWRQAIEAGNALIKRQDEALGLVREELKEPKARFANVRIGPKNAVCGRIAYPPPPRFRAREFVVMPTNEVEISGTQADFDADENAAADRLREVMDLQDECLPLDQAVAASAPTPDRKVRVDRAAAEALAADTPELLEVTEDRRTPTPAAIAAAARVGAAADANALRAIVALRSDPLLYRYVEGFAKATRVPDTDLELAIASALEIPGLRKVAVWMLPSWPQCKWRYTQQALFDALRNYATQAQAQDRGGIEQLLCGNLPGADHAIAATLVEMAPLADAAPVVDYLSKQHVAAAVPALVKRQSAIPGHSPEAARIDRALAAIATDEAMAALTVRIAWLAGRRQDASARDEARIVLATLSQMAPDPRIPYRTVAPLSIAFDDADVQKWFASWAGSWQMREAIPLLFERLDANSDAACAEAILDAGEAPDWRRLDQWMATPAAVHFVAGDGRRLADRIRRAAAEPQREASERSARQRKAAYTRAAQPYTERDLLETAKREDPPGYVAQQRAQLRGLGEVARQFADVPEAKEASRSLSPRYEELASYARFVAKDVRTAVELYDEAMHADVAANPMSVVTLQQSAADALRFDLLDPQAALERMRKARAAIAPNDPTAYWIDAEIDYLAGGRRAAPPARGQCGFLSLVLVGGGASRDDATKRLGGAATAAEAAEFLESLSPSELHLISTFPRWPAFGDPQRFLRFARKHDPAGFATACGLMLVQEMARTRAEAADASRLRGLPNWTSADYATMEAAAKQVVGAPPPPPPPNRALASPETAWRGFIAALRSGNLASAWVYTTPDTRRKFEPVFSAMPPDKLREMADSFKGFALGGSYGEFQEAFVTRDSGRAGIITFLKQGKEWRISEM
ncbi:MAG TPA: hypothetical protein VMN56_08965 [Casimicrobiaceae bacterium]|nr:hypothetical protein [Casimicrobiaceae bacterium]